MATVSSRQLAKLRAAVVCYGPAPDSAGLARIEAPVLGIYGEKDARINQDLPRVEDFMRTVAGQYEQRTSRKTEPLLCQVVDGAQ